MKYTTIKKAQAIERTYGSNYYLATLFLPKSIREAVFVLYAFVRIPDEIVDNPPPGSDAAKLLHDWKQNWETTYKTGTGTDDIMLATRDVFLQYNIPFSLSTEFIDAMILDLHKQEYATYTELKTYMRGSAEVVGVMLTNIFGCATPEAIPYAEKLGEAMQFTNFLRDIKEDYEERGRIYLPLADRERFGITVADLTAPSPSPQFIAFMQYEITHARQLFKDAEPGIALLPPYARRAVSLAARFYEGILDKLEENNYNVAIPLSSLSPLQKLRLIISSYVTN